MDAYETTIYSAILITCVILGIIIVYFGYNVFVHQRRRIAEQRQFFLTETILLEEERNRIARDIHDDLGLTLSTAITQLEILRRRPTAPKEIVDRTCEQVRSLNGKLREIAVNLTPASLARYGLRRSLELCFEEACYSSGFQIRFDYAVQTELMPEFSIHIYRIVREIVHNAAKHSRCKSITVVIKQVGRVLYLSIQDDGVGFAVSHGMRLEGGIGLKSIRNRTMMLRGRIDCQSVPGKGTDYFIEIPLP